MKHGCRQHPYRIIAPAARAALRGVVRRNAPRWHDAWRPVALFWRRQRKGSKGVRAGDVVMVTGAVWLPQFHLHFMTRVNDRPWRGVMHASLTIAAMDQRRVVMDYRKTIVQSSPFVAQPRRDQRPEDVFSIRFVRNGSGATVQVAAPYAKSVYRPGIARTTAREADHAYAPYLGPTWPGGRPGKDAQTQTLQTLRTSKRELLIFRSRVKAPGATTPPYSQASTAPQPYFYPQELVWRRTEPPAVGIASKERQADSRERTHQSPGHSFPRQEATSAMPHHFGRVPATPALKLDSALMDRLADDVIRRVERRERTERARRGL